MNSRFGRPVLQLNMVVNQMIDEIESEFKHLLRDLNQQGRHHWKGAGGELFVVERRSGILR